MPKNKDLKRLVRARMARTGEAYTTARSHASRGAARRRRTEPQRTDRTNGTAAPAAPPVDFAALAGMRDATIKAKTGCNWSRWVAARSTSWARWR